MSVVQVEQRARAASTQLRHRACIQAIADEVGKPFEEVAAIYQIELVRMAANAAVLDYLPVLVSKRVRRLCRGSH